MRVILFLMVIIPLVLFIATVYAQHAAELAQFLIKQKQFFSY